MKRYVMQCENTYDEAARIANKICELVAGGARYKDIVVVICDYDDTVAIYNEIFDTGGIAVNVDTGIKLIEHHFTKYLRDTIANSPWLTNRKPIKGKTIKQICNELLTLTQQCVDEDIKEKITQIIETCANILGDQATDLNEFNNMFCTLAAASKISDVPNYADRVLLVSVKEYEPAFTPYLFVTAAASGAFPNTTADTDIITEQDIGAMSIHIEPSASMQNCRARVHAQNILNSATQELYISYSATNIKGERVGLTELVDPKLLENKAQENLASKAYAKQKVLVAIGNGDAFKDDKSTYWASIQAAVDFGDFAIPKLELDAGNIQCGTQLLLGNNKASVSQIENFFKCPYYHFLMNGLRVEEHNFDKVGANTVGTILHGIVHDFVKNKMENTPTDINKITQNALREYQLPRYTVQAIKKQARLIAKFLTTDIEQNEFKPHLLEHKMQSEIDGITLRGIADRIDIVTGGDKPRAMVVDYKSGSSLGVKLQLPLYMGFLRDDFTPEGAYYLSLKNFKKTQISSDEIEPGMDAAHGAIHDIKDGVIAPKPYNKSVCAYCPARAMCSQKGGAK